MTGPEHRSLGEQNYEPFAERFAQVAETGLYNAQYERPATLSLLPDVAGKRVLDAGCGPGIYTAWLLDHGADVVAVAVTPAFVDITRQRVGDRAAVLCADLTQPLGFAEADSFDVVVSPLVFDDIEDWRATLAEFCRVLRPGGLAVFSCGHPFYDWRKHGRESYFHLELVEAEWQSFGEPRPLIRWYRRPLSAMIGAILGAGLLLDALVEPLPTEQFRQADPEAYAKLMREPGFICFRARKP